ncbi:hypothetical protein RI367_003073 [Sorochytrium milnesiophthora]
MSPLNVVVVGGSSGIGAAIVDAFAAAGHRVLFTYYSHRPATTTTAAAGVNVAYTFLDQGDVASITRFAAGVRAWLAQSPEGTGKLDVLINNAALGSGTVQGYVRSKGTAPLIEGGHVSEDTALMTVNALGPMWITERLLPMMQPRSSSTSRSTVIFLGSVGGSSGVFPEYRASDLMSKAAVSYLAQHLAAEHSHSSIDVVCVSPGATETAMFRSSTIQKLAHPDAFLRQMPKGRLIQPSEVAELIHAICTTSWGRVLHGANVDASLGLAVRPGLQTEMGSYERQLKQATRTQTPTRDTGDIHYNNALVASAPSATTKARL